MRCTPLNWTNANVKTKPLTNAISNHPVEENPDEKASAKAKVAMTHNRSAMAIVKPAFIDQSGDNEIAIRVAENRINPTDNVYQ